MKVNDTVNMLGNAASKPEHIRELEKEILTLTREEAIEVAEYVSKLREGGEKIGIKSC